MCVYVYVCIIMGRIQVILNDETEQKFREELAKEGKIKGSISEEIENLVKIRLSRSREGDFCQPEDVKSDNETLSEATKFYESIDTLEKKSGQKPMLLHDKKSGAFYCECHIYAKDLIEFSDPDAVIDPELQAEFRANRELEPENFYFLQMVADAEKGRQFSDIVIEYNTNYLPSKPLKILGGQHRREAITKALTKKINAPHGVKIYFNLNNDQRAEIMRISNTNINVSPDLRDRIEEQRLKPPSMLRNFCYVTGILKSGEDFGDKRKNEDFTPTVRMMRGFIVNFYMGKSYIGNIDKDAMVPYLPESGRHIDIEYLKIFDKYKPKETFDDTDLIEAGKKFAKLHETQLKNSEKYSGAAKKEFKIKSFNLAIITSWAFTAGVLQTDKRRLKKFYDLPILSGADDPLNASAMGKAHYKTDPETYRGLATRTDQKERGRVLQLFLQYSASPKPKITEQMCNAAIEIFHANQGSINSEKKRQEAFG